MKRVIDIVVAAIAGTVLLVPACAVAVAVKATSRGPIIHWSTRIGRNGRTFRMPKFRTMKVGTPQVATDRLVDPRSHLTPIGGVLRRSSLDELPQLWSVVAGDMSLVGPRPALFNQYELIEARRAQGVDSLRPGITGWAQINGRDDLSDEQKVALDVEYLNRVSIRFDLRILVSTVKRVVRSEGIDH